MPSGVTGAEKRALNGTRFRPHNRRPENDDVESLYRCIVDTGALAPPVRGGACADGLGGFGESD